MVVKGCSTFLLRRDEKCSLQSTKKSAVVNVNRWRQQHQLVLVEVDHCTFLMVDVDGTKYYWIFLHAKQLWCPHCCEITLTHGIT